DRPRPTLADYLTIVLSPLLIMALVGSLVFFLLEILYAGAYQSRMQWILFFFVFGMVLIARISMIPEIANRSGLYGLILGTLTWAAPHAVVQSPPDSVPRMLAPVINAGLVALVWWCAHRLTWDCTHIDEEAEVTGEGLLQASGLEQTEGGGQRAEGGEPKAGD